MRLPRTRSVALAASCLLAATLAPAAASGAAGSLLITPGVLERAARPGPFGTVTISNTTGRAMRVGFAVRPWRQSRNGSVTPNRRKTLPKVRPSRRSFRLPAGTERAIGLTLAGRPKRRSLYGALEVTGTPQSRRRTGVRVGYRLVGALRLHPPTAARRYRARAGRLHGRGGALFLAVRNAGNTIDPIGGRVTISGRGRTLRRKIAPRAILPGRTVDLRLIRLRGTLPAGRYRLGVRLTQAGRNMAGFRRGIRLR